MRTISIMFWLSIHLLLGLALIYPLVSNQNVTKGIAESLTIGVLK